MTSIQKKWVAIGAAVGVWVAGLAAAAILAFVLGRPVHVPFVATATAAPRTGVVSEPRGAVLEAPVLLEVDPISIFGERPHYAPAAAEPTPNVARDIDQMSCTGWRELQAGSGHVQICE